MCRNVEKALEIGKTSATGSFQLLIGVASSTIIMAIGTIILGRIMTTDEYGLYGIVLIPSTLINLFRDWGINSAMTRYIANFRTTQKEKEMHSIIVAGLVFEFASGLAFSFLSLFLATFIASTIFNRPESASYIAIMSVSIIAGSILAACQAAFIGFERMKLNSFTLICQAIAKTAIGPLLVFLGYSVLGAVLGNAISVVAAAFIGLATFYVILLRPLRKRTTSGTNITQTLRTMLHYGVPLMISTSLAGILTQVYAFMIVPLTSNTMYGNYLTAANFSVLLTFFTVPIATTLFPAFAKLNPENEHDLIKTLFASSIKYTSLLLVPATMILMALSSPIIGTLYGEKYIYGPFFLAIMVIGNLFVTLGNISAGGLLTGLGKTKIPMYQSIVTIIIGLPLGVALIPMFGIAGLIIAGILSGIPSMIWALYWIWKQYKAKADFQSSAKIVAASALAAILAYLPATYLPMANWIRLIIGLAVFLTAYVITAPLIGAVYSADISNLRTMFAGMGIVSKTVDPILRVAEKVAQTKTLKRAQPQQTI
jgi:O-antigen/teichoic acid export membrane protein